jgi:subfamily B ATP-binding cassette protein MsbA
MLSPAFHDGQRSGDLLTRVGGDVSRVQDSLVVWFTTLAPEALTLVGMLAILVLIDPVMAATALGITPALAVVMNDRRRRIRGAQRRSRDAQGSLAAALAETLRNVPLIQAFGRERHTASDFERRNKASARTSMWVDDLSGRYAALADVLLAAGGGAVLVLGVAQVLSGRMTLGVLLVVMSYVAGLYGPIRSLSRVGSTLSKGAASRERIEEILRAPVDIADAPAARPLLEMRDAVCFEQVWFGYRTDSPVVRGLDLTIESGEWLTIMGPTGAGKSTLLGLMLRLYDAWRGAITVDGADVRDLRLADLRRVFAIVPQDSWIVAGSLRDNLSFGDPLASERCLLEAARLALVDEFADRFGGFDAEVGEGGRRLSGGQRQRLALARALVRNSPVLLLDEPTAGLDAESKRLVLAALTRVAGDRTLVTVTHDPEVAACADRVIVLEDGRVSRSYWARPAIPSEVRAADTTAVSGQAGRPAKFKGGDSYVTWQTRRQGPRSGDGVRRQLPGTGLGGSGGGNDRAVGVGQ